jgi:hypothetical protein
LRRAQTRFMKTIEQILAEANTTIAHMHLRPSMYIGSTSRPNAGEMFDGMIWVAHWFWATIQSREKEFREVADSVRQSRNCSNLGFSDAYRLQNPTLDDQDVFQHVRSCWEEIDKKLGIDISENAARSLSGL